ncbi:MAG: type II toxin-antitoxin system Phd/YefM family antitoxin [Armatimonadota bacterium]
MTRVGVRELRQQASALLRRVESGERFEITDRGRPVAMLGPVSDKGPLVRLRASGNIISARAGLNDLPRPLPLAPGQEPPSSVLARLRRNER